MDHNSASSPDPPDDADAGLRLFIEAAVQSGLTDRTALTEGLAAIPPSEWNAARLAEALVQSGLLTGFQAEKLLAGLTQGLILGPYRLLYPIGRGAVGIVYLARDARVMDGPHRLQALKVLPPRRARDEPRTLARFRHEMAIGACLPPHACLARSLESGVYSGVHYLAMEYAHGPTTKQLVHEQGPLSVSAAARIFADVARALQAVHAAGIIHRDVKPSNVIAVEPGRGKLLDFGFAYLRGQKSHDDPTVLGGEGYTLGTLDFMAPEQAQNATAVGPETDIYSLGCSLYYALSGQVPFPDGTAQEKLRQHRKTAAEPLTKRNPAVPEPFARLVAWMMSKRPEERPQSMEAVAGELEPWAGPPTAARLSDPREWEERVLREVASRWRTYRAGGQENLATEDLILLEDSVPPAKPPMRLGRDTTPAGTPAADPPAEANVVPPLYIALAALAVMAACAGCGLLGGLVLWLRLR